METADLSREREIVLERFYELSPAEQLATYLAVRDYLAARLTLVKRDTVVEERAASLDIFKQVAEHLSLATGVGPTPAEFDAACRVLGLPWNRSRVKRAWGRWRFGKDAFLGEDHDSAPRRRARGAVGDKRRRSEAPVRAVRLWLATEPAKLTWSDYRKWAREYNAELGPSDLPVGVDPHNLTRPMGIRWRDLVRHAAGEISLDEARPSLTRDQTRYCRGPHDLVGMAEIQPIFGGSQWKAQSHAAKHSFPGAVIDLPAGRLWLRSDVEAYAQKRAFPERTTNELRSDYLTADEVASVTGLAVSTVRRGFRKFPETAVSLGSIRLWLRSEVVAWLNLP